MKVGGIRTLSVPWPLAYGAEGKPNPEDPGAGIPPRADLHFTIELLGVNPPDFDRSDLPD
jgi:FKBP-type peptidyl-prolyl cis-trans isomerase